MESIANSLRDPSWWFTAVLVAIVASTIAGFAKDYFERRLGLFLSWSQTKREQAKIKRKGIIDAWSKNESLVIIAFLKMLFTVIMFLSVSILLVVYMTYLRLKYGVVDVTDVASFRLLPYRSVGALSICFIVLCSLAWKTGSVVARLTDCLRQFRESRGLPIFYDEEV